VGIGETDVAVGVEAVGVRVDVGVLVIVGVLDCDGVVDDIGEFDCIGVFEGVLVAIAAITVTEES
jgi:hypothetical protein